MTSGTWRATEGYVGCLNVDGARPLEESGEEKEDKQHLTMQVVGAPGKR